METIELNAELREGGGKAVARRMRREGKIPGIFYGPKRGAVKITVDAKEFSHKVSEIEGAHLIRFLSQAAEVKACVALVKDTQFHPVTGGALHVDFYEVDLTKRIRVRAPLHFTGKAAGVALGGILQPVRRDVEVECLPSDMPEFISVDVSALNIHDAIHVSQLQPPEGVEVVYDTDFAIVSVIAPSVEETKAAATPEAAEAVAEAAPKPEADKKAGEKKA